MHANHGHQGALQQDEASNEHEGRKGVVVPGGKVVHGNIYNQGYPRDQFDFGGNHPRRIGLVQTEDLDSDYMDDALEDAEACHCECKQRDAVSPEKGNDGHHKDKHPGIQAACPLQFRVDIPLQHVGRDKIQESSRIVSFFPFMQDIKERQEYGKLLDDREIIHEDGNAYNQQHGNHRIDFQRIVLDKFPHKSRRI